MRRPIALSQTALKAVLTTIMTRLWHSILCTGSYDYQCATSSLWLVDMASLRLEINTNIVDNF